MLGACRAADPAGEPGARARARPSGALATAGRDKLTFVIDPEIASFGAWAGAAHRGEHRQARRRDRAGGPRAARRRRRPTAPTASSSGSPRRLGRPGAARTARRPTPSLDALAAAGHPVIRIALDDPIDLGGRVRPLGGGHRDRRGRPRHRPVRPAQRRRGQGAHAPGPRASAMERPRSTAPPARPDRRAADGLALHGDAALRLTAGDGTLVGELRRATSPAAERLPRAPGVHRPDGRARTPRSPGSGRSCATGPAAPPRPATVRASSTRPASSTRAALRSAGSSS